MRSDIFHYAVRGLGVNFSPPQDIGTFRGRTRLTIAVRYSGVTFNPFSGGSLFSDDPPINGEEPPSFTYELGYLDINNQPQTETIVHPGPGPREFVIGPRLAGVVHTPTFRMKSLPPATWAIEWSAVETQEGQMRRGQAIKRSEFSHYLRTGMKR